MHIRERLLLVLREMLYNVKKIVEQPFDGLAVVFVNGELHGRLHCDAARFSFQRRLVRVGDVDALTYSDAVELLERDGQGKDGLHFLFLRLLGV